MGQVSYAVYYVTIIISFGDFLKPMRAGSQKLNILLDWPYVCVGIAERAITSIRQEASCGRAVFLSPVKRYEVSRRRVLVDTSDHEAIK